MKLGNVSVLVVALLLAGVTACVGPDDAEAPPDTADSASREEPADVVPADGSLGISEDEAYALAAADGVAYDPPFSVYRPTWLPDGFVFESARNAPAGATDGSGGVLVTYSGGDAIITVGVEIGDIGDADPEFSAAWGTYGECRVYSDAWDDSHIALAPTPGGAYTPNVRTAGVSREDLERVLGGMELVEP